MSNIVPFESGRPPAVFANRRTSLNHAAQQGVQPSFAVIGYKGSKWSVKYRGETEVLIDASKRPIPFLDVVIVGVSPNISKQWYGTKFVEGSDAAPDCFSVDGVQPDPSSPKKQCATCAVCPKNAWGSRITDAGKKGKECQDSRRVAVVPLGDLQNETYGGPMMLRVPPMSLNNLASYAAMLQRKGASLEFVATRLAFDYNEAYPKITFEAIGWLNDEQAREVVGEDGESGVCAHPSIERMLQEAVVEATHAPEPEPAAADPLSAGGPAQVFRQTLTVVEEPVQAPAAEPVRAPEPEPAPAAAPPRRRASSAFQSAPQEAAPAAPQQSPSEVTPRGDSEGDRKVGVQPAPADLNSAIDELLAM